MIRVTWYKYLEGSFQPSGQNGCNVFASATKLQDITLYNVLKSISIMSELRAKGHGSSPLRPSYENFPLLPVSVTIYSSGILASCGVIIVIIRGWVKTRWGVIIRSKIIIIVESLTSSSSRLLPVWIVT
uniref:Uncharacterized protein n=1 Tax=Glossina brevipalpis TaxID=37001 RepID=A0A1A9W7J0_9MUSC